ncbi:Holliday junction resolvase Hjc [Pyrobaculum aerophilum]|uniref:Crossover junction endodeoxyribonuclease Hjc n=2 Tax=Pyrobaculum aerophilum TaxID=13773 RepID=Q8ZVR2_PYRAE|nr:MULTISPECIES: Holliday junction resolvase Hjc [Pyrobaculum]AAL63994.1 Holliday Junction Resolvase [Pyrobaculum aerophilum str. IM2]MCX8136410.1 Holliday junction resolvase Hjc [Pyrobaculum aerophilum]HII47237.1 Holliday junction resolvase [Pyrobaculum aerophilum]
MSVKRKGSAKERELANFFWERGCAVLRGCSSGGGVRKRYVPDVVAICKGKVLVFEVKYRSKYTPIKIEREKLEKLAVFAKRAGGEAYLLVKYGRNPWKVLEIRDKIDREEYEKAVELRAFLEALFSQTIDRYF